MNERRDVYGHYSLGSGAILPNPDRVWSALADPEVLTGYDKSMRSDLAKSGIALSCLADWHVMDVGTGRQALTFLNLGAKRVSHFDISEENVARVHNYSAGAAADRLQSTCCDLVEIDLGVEKFDFVYLNRIVQHFSNVGRGLANCIRALKPGGYLWLYSYRSETFDNFVLYMLRDLAYGSNVASDQAMMRDYFVASRLFFSLDVRPNYLTSIFMDGIFTRYAQLFTPATYLEFARACEFEVVSTSGLDPLGREVDHVFARAATVMTLRKKKTISDADLLNAARLLSPTVAVNQLDPDLYTDPEILCSLELYADLKSRLSGLKVPSALISLTVMRLFATLAQVIRAAGFDPMRRHEALQQTLSECVGLLKLEYAPAG